MQNVSYKTSKKKIRLLYDFELNGDFLATTLKAQSTTEKT